jgi:hypothetical protein
VVVFGKNALKLSSGSSPILQIHVEYMTQAK